MSSRARALRAWYRGRRLAVAVSRGAERAVFVLLVFVVVGSLMAAGAVHTPVLAVAAAAAILAAIAGLARAPRYRLPAPAIVALALAAYTVLQAIPVPLATLAAIAPKNADVWARCLHPFGEGAPSWASLSLDPGASWVESLKWTSYAAVFAASAAYARRRGHEPVVALVFGAAFAAVLVLVIHAGVGTKRLFGIYEPLHADPHWGVAPLLNENNFGGYAGLGAFSGLALMITSHRPALRWLVGVATAALFAAVIASGSRGAVLAQGIGVVAVAGFLLRRREGPSRRGADWALLLGIAVVLALGVALGALGGTETTWSSLRDRSTSKVEMILWSRPMVHDHFWLGVGRGAFETAFQPYRGGHGHFVYGHAENLGVQWASEWGVVVAIVAAMALLWTMRPRRLIPRDDGIGSIVVVIGVLALVLHNLVDLSLEVPAVMFAVAALLGGLWGSASKSREHRRPAEGHSSASLARKVLAVAAWAGAITTVTAAAAGTLVLGSHAAVSDRDVLSKSFRRTDFRDASAAAAFRAELRAAILRHPGDAFLPLLGALAARHETNGKPLVWLSRSLERDAVNGRAHLLTAQVLADSGARRQALMELRLAATYEPNLAPLLADLAVAWARDPAEIWMVVPDGGGGVALMIQLARRRPVADPLRERLLATALERDPRASEARVALANDLLDALATANGAGRCAGALRLECVRQAEEHARQLAETSLGRGPGLILRARLLLANDHPVEAVELLADGCMAHPQVTECLRWRVTAALAVPARGSDALREAERAYVGAACTTPEDCAVAAEWLGELHAGRSDWSLAVEHYSRATTEAPNAARWLVLARAATQAGQTSRAKHAFERAAGEAQGDPNVIRQIEEARGQLVDAGAAD